MLSGCCLRFGRLVGCSGERMGSEGTKAGGWGGPGAGRRGREQYRRRAHLGRVLDGRGEVGHEIIDVRQVRRVGIEVSALVGANRQVGPAVVCVCAGDGCMLGRWVGGRGRSDEAGSGGARIGVRFDANGGDGAGSGVVGRRSSSGDLMRCTVGGVQQVVVKYKRSTYKC